MQHEHVWQRIVPVRPGPLSLGATNICCTCGHITEYWESEDLRQMVQDELDAMAQGMNPLRLALDDYWSEQCCPF